MFATTESALVEFARCATVILVPPLRVRRQDLGEWLSYRIRQRARGLGWNRPPRVCGAVVMRLQSHDFPGNVKKLEG